MKFSTNPLLMLFRRGLILTVLLGACIQLTLMGVSDASYIAGCYELPSDCESDCPVTCAGSPSHECSTGVFTCSTGKPISCICYSPAVTPSTPGTSESAQPPAACVESLGHNCPSDICQVVYKPEWCGYTKPYLCGCGNPHMVTYGDTPATPGTPSTPSPPSTPWKR